MTQLEIIVVILAASLGLNIIFLISWVLRYSSTKLKRKKDKEDEVNGRLIILETEVAYIQEIIKKEKLKRGE